MRNTEQSKKPVYGITLETAQKHLDEWLEAELNVTTHQSYTMGSKTLTLADLGTIGRQIKYWNDMVMRLQAQSSSGGRNRMFRGVPRDW